MRACIIGAGLSGSLLAWRLGQAGGVDWRIDLILGVPHPTGRADATAASGGAVRAYETDPRQRRLAIDSLAELLASPTLRDWAGYQPTGSAYVRSNSADLPGAVAEIEEAVPGSAQVVTADDLAAAGWTGLPQAATAVLESAAGYTSPARLRESVLADGGLRGRVAVHEVTVDRVSTLDNGTLACQWAGETHEYDLVVAATGPWTRAFLQASGLPTEGYRTKVVQYAVHPANGWLPPAFVDETSGLFGRPTADGGLLLGLPTDHWDLDPDTQPDSSALRERAAELARQRFPRLDIGPAGQPFGSADCYCDPPILSLRPVLNSASQAVPWLFTFTGGSGGSAKTALAASSRAAADLVTSGAASELIASGDRRGHS